MRQSTHDNIDEIIDRHRADAWQKGWATGFAMAAAAALGGTLLVMFFRNFGE
jgi:hypothetical protein